MDLDRLELGQWGHQHKNINDPEAKICWTLMFCTLSLTKSIEINYVGAFLLVNPVEQNSICWLGVCSLL